MSSQSIHKFAISMGHDARVKMPLGATVVRVGTEPSSTEPGVWALVDPDALETEERKFGVYGTYGRVPNWWTYRGSFQGQDGQVWHVFEENLSSREQEP